MNNLKKRRTSVLIGLALMGLSVHAYAADVTATTDTPTMAASTEVNGASESHVINVTANRMALLDLDTPAAMDVITQKDLAVGVWVLCGPNKCVIIQICSLYNCVNVYMC